MRRALISAVVVLLAACASPPTRDGPPAKVPADLANLRDAEPRVEPIRSGGPNRSYEAFGREYVPMTQDVAFRERGLASWYGRKFQGRPTASGEVYDMFAMTAAHPTLPIPSYARITNPANGRSVIVRVNDRGPFHAGRIVDLSYAAAYRLDLLRGVAPVLLERLTFKDIRAAGARPEAAAAPGRSATAAPMASPTPTAPIAGPAAAAAPVVPPVLETAPSGGYWIQLGAFRLREGAQAFERRVGAEIDWLESMLVVFRDSGLFRLQAGPFDDLAQAQRAAERVRDQLKLVPVVVERP
jgi:rare lipoprotein A